MSISLSEILEHDAPHLFITNRRTLLAFYDAVVAALRQGELTPEGGAVPTTLNTLLGLLPGEQTAAACDREMTDWSVENDLKYAAFLDVWRTQMTAQRSAAPKPRAVAAPLHQAVTRLQLLHTAGKQESRAREGR